MFGSTQHASVSLSHEQHDDDDKGDKLKENKDEDEDDDSGSTVAPPETKPAQTSNERFYVTEQPLRALFSNAASSGIFALKTFC